MSILYGIRAEEDISLDCSDPNDMLPDWERDYNSLIASIKEAERHTEMIAWRELEVHDVDGFASTLGDIVDNAPANLDSATIVDGSIAVWPQYVICAPGEAANWDTPRGPVDWTGFESALKAVRGAEAA